MDIKTNMRTVPIESVNMKDKKSDTVATGWVEIEGMFKFPVAVRTYYDTEKGSKSMFVSYPQRKRGNEYVGVVYPHDKGIRKEIDAAVLKDVQEKFFTQSVPDVKIDEIRITPLNQKSDAVVKNLGIASIKMYGMTINGIIIKEGRRGAFVQMPQYFSDGAYHDTVYGITSAVQKKLEEQIMEQYHQEYRMAEEKAMQEQQKAEENQVNDKQEEKQQEAVKEASEEAAANESVTQDLNNQDEQRDVSDESPEETYQNPVQDTDDEHKQEEYLYTADEAVEIISALLEEEDSNKWIVGTVAGTPVELGKAVKRNGYLESQEFRISANNTVVYGRFQTRFGGDPLIEPIPVGTQIMLQVIRGENAQEPYLLANHRADARPEAESGYKACLTEWAQITRQPELTKQKTVQNIKQPAAPKNQIRLH